MLRAPNECYKHQRRKPNKETLVTVGVILPVTSINQNQFLSNDYSKCEFIKLLAMQVTKTKN